MDYTLKPKQKSEVQFNGRIENEINWTVPFVSNVQKEFDSRYEKIKKEYEDLIDEVYWNSIIYQAKINFKPVINHSYYLYKNEENYFLSLISPREWKREGLGEFKFTHTGKWIKI